MKIIITGNYLCLAAFLASTTAQSADICRDEDGNFEQSLSQNWLDFRSNASLEPPASLVGRWEGSNFNPNNVDQTQDYEIIYASDGKYAAVTRSCSSAGCSYSHEAGFWAARTDGNQLEIMTNISDEKRNDYCKIRRAEIIDQNIMQFASGLIVHKVVH